MAKVLIDPRSRLVIYSNAGHPPPILLSPDGGCQLLDQATDPPLGARPEHVPRPQAGLPYLRGDTLVEAVSTEAVSESISEIETEFSTFPCRVVRLVWTHGKDSRVLRSETWRHAQ
ncbi:hypothetical protein GCM10011428_26490 [Streptomyces violaceus]